MQVEARGRRAYHLLWSFYGEEVVRHVRGHLSVLLRRVEGGRRHRGGDCAYSAADEAHVQRHGRGGEGDASAGRSSRIAVPPVGGSGEEQGRADGEEVRRSGEARQGN